MSLLVALIGENSHGLAEIYFIFLKKTSCTKLERLSMPNLDLSEKIGKVLIRKNKF